MYIIYIYQFLRVGRTVDLPVKAQSSMEASAQPEVVKLSASQLRIHRVGRSLPEGGITSFALLTPLTKLYVVLNPKFLCPELPEPRSP